MRRNAIETVMGAVVLAVAIVFLVFAYSMADVGGSGGSRYLARFDRVDGVTVGTDVRIGGIKVGAVAGQRLATEDYYRVELALDVDSSIPLPSDTVAVVASESLLGGRYVALEPGGMSDMIAPGGTIEYTQSTPGIEQLLGQVIYSLQGMGKQDQGSGSSANGGGAGQGSAPGGLVP